MEIFLSAITQGLGFTGLGLGIFLSLKVFNIPDITTDGSYTLGGAITAVLLSSGYHPLIAIILSIILGSTAGLCTGIIHTRLKIHPLLAGILVMTALYSINLLIMSRPNIPLINESTVFEYHLSGNDTVNKLTIMLLLSSMFGIIIIWLLQTDFGIAMRATGNSESMIRAMGVNTDAMKIMGLAIANGLTALSGSLMVQYQGFADINMGIGIVISGLGAVIIGDAIIKYAHKKTIVVNIIGVILGTIIFRLLLAAALLMGLQPILLKLVTSLIVLSVVGFVQLSVVEKK